MRNGDLAPLCIVDYDKEYLIDYVRHKTSWNQRDEVSCKIQLNYLCNYLKSHEIACKTIVIENEYIDRHYLEDYSEYYARCFSSYERKCSRLHFFSEKIVQEEYEFIKKLEINDKDFQKKLNDSYIGFAVIRPIPHTFFAKICVLPYRSLKTRQNTVILLKEIPVSLFGIPLTLKTIPFIEQDKVVSACATSALWVALSALPEISYLNLPSPSAITKSGTQAHHDGTRTFPTVGLTPPQVARSLKYYGMEPSIHYFTDLAKFKEYLYSHIANGTPVILGGDIYEKIDDGQYRHAGAHLVCAVGYNTKTPASQKNSSPLGKISLSSHRIDKIYVHDDRHGPFVKVTMEGIKISTLEGERKGIPIVGFNQSNEFFVPGVIILGLPNKVRIPYTHTLDVCESLYYYLNVTSTLLGKGQNADQSILPTLKPMLDGDWELTLKRSTDLKQELLACDAFHTFNGVSDKRAFLLQSLPKHLWRCRIHVNDQDEDFNLKESDASISGQGGNFTDMLFDATEVPQGRFFLGYITYNQSSQKMWDYIETQIIERSWPNFGSASVPPKAKEGISCILKFFHEFKDKIYLNTKFGPIGIARRSPKDGELDGTRNISKRDDIRKFWIGSPPKDLTDFNQKIKYIWVINEVGEFVYGEDIIGSEAKLSQGHPTLIDGKPGRIAGEFFYNDAKWKINLKSRAYSGHIDPYSDAAKQYLTNVITSFFSSSQIAVDDEYHQTLFAQEFFLTSPLQKTA